MLAASYKPHLKCLTIHCLVRLQDHRAPVCLACVATTIQSLSSIECYLALDFLAGDKVAHVQNHNHEGNHTL